MSTPSPAPRRGLFHREPGPRAGLRDLLPYLARHRGILIAAVLLSLVGAAASLLQPALVSQVIGRVQKGESLGPLVGALVALVIVSGLLSGLQHYLLQRTGTSVVFSARQELVRRILRLPIAEVDLRRTGDLVSRVGSDTTLLYAVITQGLVDSVGGIILFLGAIVGMAIIDPVLLGLTVLVVVIALALVVGLGGPLRRASREQQERVGDLSASVERAVSAIRTIRAANATERETEAVEVHARAAWRAGVRVARVSALIVPVAGIALQVAFLVVLGVGGFRVASGAITIAQLVAFILFLFLMVMPLGQAFGAITSVNQALGALGRIREVLAVPSEGEADAEVDASRDGREADPASASRDWQGSHRVAGFSGGHSVKSRPFAGGRAAAIEFADVRFAYPERAHRTEQEKALAAEFGESQADAPAGRDVLHGVSFAVPRGARVALVGPSGAGKSTILALVERFYDPTGGAVLLDGVDIRSLPRAEVRSRLGYVEQDAPVLAGTLRDNLVLGAPDASDAECVRVLREVSLGEVLDRSPRGLDAQVGDDGVLLSGGERQRLAIARALLQSSPILLLDEATASLDGVTEQLLRDAIDRASADRTLLVIAHRLATVIDSDLIVVLEAGRVVGSGTHAELLGSSPLYRELAERQLLV